MRRQVNRQAVRAAAVLLAVSVSWPLAKSGHSATVNFTGGADGTGTDFNTAANWDLARVPTTGDDAYINKLGVLLSSGSASFTRLRVGQSSTPGMFTMSGGTIAANNDSAVGASENNVTSYMFMTGGTWNQTGLGIHLGADSNQSSGVLDLSGTAIINVTGNGNENNGGSASTNAIMIGQSGPGFMFIRGNASVTTSQNFTVGLGMNASKGLAVVADSAQLTVNKSLLIAGNYGAATTGILNQTGGTITANANPVRFGKGNASAAGTYNFDGGTLITTGLVKDTGTGTFNLNGGTIRAGNANNAGAFMQNLTAANVYAGGVTFDTNGYNITVGQALLGTTGTGLPIGALAAGTGSAGTLSYNAGTTTYNQVPTVTFDTPTGGIAATGYATLDPVTGLINGVYVTSPGSGYTSAPNVTFSGGVVKVAATNPTAAVTLTGSDNTLGGLTKSGAGVLALTGASTYTGKTTINAGTLSVNSLANGGAASPLGKSASAAGNLVFGSSSSVLQYTGGGTIIDRLFTINAGGATIDASGTGALGLNNPGAIAFNATPAPNTLTLTGSYAGANSFSPAITDSGTGANVTSVVKSGIGNWVLAGTNSYSGGTTISGGLLQFNTGALPGSGTVNIQSGGALVAAGPYTTVNDWLTSNRVSTSSAGAIALTGNSSENINLPAINSGAYSGLSLGATGNYSYTGTLTPVGSTYRLGGGGGTLTVPGTNVISGGNSLVIGGGGGGKVVLSDANNFTGGTTIGAGVLQLGHINSAQNSTVAVNASNGLTFSAGVITPAIGGLAGTGSIALQDTAATPAAVALTVGGNNANTAFSGTLSGPGSLVKTGIGTLTFSGAGLYAGPTVITAGKVQLAAPTQLPNVVGGSNSLQLWLDATDPYGNGTAGPANNTALGTWYDKSGTLRNATQGAAGNQPLYVSAGINGKPVMNLAGNRFFTFSPTGLAAGSAASTMFTVGDLPTLPNYYNWMVTYGNNSNYAARGLGVMNTNVPAIISYNGDATAPSALTANTPVVMDGVWGGTSGYSINGRFITAGGTQTAQANPALGTVLNYGRIGHQVGDNANEVWNGRVGEVLIYNGALTDAQRQGVESYLNYKWLGIAANVLPTASAVQIDSGAVLDLAGVNQQVAALVDYQQAGSQGAVTNSSAAAVTLTLGGTTGSNTFSGTISGPINLVKSGGATQVLNGADTFTGGTTISGGVLQLGNANALQNSTVTESTANGLAFTPGIGTFTLGGLAGASNQALQDTNSGTVTVNVGNNNASTTYSGNLSGPGALVKVGTGTLTLSGTNTAYAGGISVNGGNMVFSSAAAIPASPKVVINGGGTVNVTGAYTTVMSWLASGSIDNSSAGALALTTTTTEAVDLTQNGNYNSLSLGAVGSVSYSGVLTPAANTYRLGGGGGTLTVSSNLLETATPGTALVVGPVGNSGTVILTGNNTFTGNTTINAGSTLQVGAGGTAGNIAIAAGNTITNNGSLVINRSDNVTIAAAVNGTGAVTKTAANLLTLSAANNYSGVTTVASGSLQLSNANAAQNSTINGYANNGVFFASGGTYTLGGLSGQGAIALQDGTAAAVALRVGNNNASTSYYGALSGSGELQKVGSGVLVLGGANTYSGPTTINGGTLRLNPAGAVTAATPARWFDASNPSTVILNSSGQVTTWKDLSGSGADATATTPTGGGTLPGPAYQAGAVNGLSAMSFQAGQSLSFTQDTGVRTVISIFKGASFLLGDANRWDFHRTGADNDPTAPLFSDQYSSANPKPGTWSTYVNGVSVNGTTYNMPTNLNNGFNLVDVQTGGNVNASDFNADRPPNNYHSNAQSQGEVLIFNSALTLAQRQSIEAYLAYKWFGVSAWSLIANPPAVLPTTSAVNITGSTATLDMNGVSQAIGSLAGVSGSSVLLGGATLTTGGDGTSTAFSGVISGSGAVFKTGAGTMTLGGANTFTGSTTINAGAVQLANDSALQNSAVTVTPANGLLFSDSIGTFTLGGLSGAGSVALQDTALAAVTLRVGSGGGSGSYSGVLSGPGSLVKLGAGSQVLSAANTYGGSTSIQGGTVSAALLADGGTASSIGSSGNDAGNLVLDGGTLQYTGAAISTDRLFTVSANGGALDASGSGAVTFTNSGALVLSGTGNRTLTLTGANTANNTLTPAVGDPTGGTTAVVKSGAGTWVLSGPNAYSGGTTLSGGELGIADNTNIGGAASAITFSGGLLRIAGTAVQNLDSHTVNWSTFNGGFDIVDAANAFTVTQTVSGNGSLTKLGAGTLMLPSANSYAGGTSLGGGTTSFASGALGTTGSITFTGAARLQWASGNSQDLSAGNRLKINAGAAAILDTNGNDVTLANPISAGTAGAGNMTKTGGGTLVLAAASTYSGVTTVDSGTLQLGNATAVGSVAGSVVNNASLVFANPATQTYSGAISGTGTLTKTGASTLVLSGPSTYSGATIITGGTVQLSPPVSLPNVAAGGNSLQLWLDATDPNGNGSTVTNGTAMGTWADKSGNARNAGQGTAANQPIYTTGAINGKAAMDLSANQFMTFSPAGLASGSSPSTIFGVGSLTSVPGNWSWLATYGAAGAGLTRGFGVRAGGAPVMTCYGTDPTAATALTAGTPVVMDGVWGGPSGNSMVGQFTTSTWSQAVAGNATLNTPLNVAYIGRQTSNAENWTGQVGEVLIYNGALSDSQRQQVEAYLNYKWLGIAPNILPAASPVQLDTGATLDLNGVNQQVASLDDYTATSHGAVTNTSATPVTLGLGGSGFTTFSGVISGPIGLVKSGAGTQTLRGDNTYTGPTVVNSGAIALGHANAAKNSSLRINSSGGLQFGSGIGTFNVGALGGASNIALQDVATSPVTLRAGGNNASSVYAGGLTGNGSLVKVGTGTLTLSGTNTLRGPTTINGGTVRLDTSGIMQTVAPSRWYDASNPANLTIDASGYVSAWKDLSGNGADANLNIVGSAAGAPTYIAQAVNGLGAVHFDLNQAMTFARDSNIQTVISVFAGSGFMLADHGWCDFHRNGNMTDPAAALLFPQQVAWQHGNAYVNGVQIADPNQPMPLSPSTNGFNLLEVVSRDGTSFHANQFNRDRTFGADSVNYHDGIQSQGEVLMFDRVLTVDERRAVENYLYTKWLGVTPAPILSPNSAVNITGSGACLDLNGLSQTVGSLAGVAGSSVTLGSATLTAGGDNTSTEFAGVISGAGGLIKQGSGTLTLSGVNTYTGSTRVQAGGLTLAAGSSLASSSLNITSDATLAGTGTYNGAEVVYSSTSPSTFGGTIAGTATSLDVTSTGPLTISGTNSYGGGTTVWTDATLNVATASALPTGGSLTIQSGGTVVLSSGVAAAAASQAAPPASSSANAVPEPGMLALLAAGAVVLGAAAWRRRNATRGSHNG